MFSFSIPVLLLVWWRGAAAAPQQSGCPPELCRELAAAANCSFWHVAGAPAQRACRSWATRSLPDRSHERRLRDCTLCGVDPAPFVPTASSTGEIGLPPRKRATLCSATPGSRLQLPTRAELEAHGASSNGQVQASAACQAWMRPQPYRNSERGVTVHRRAFPHGFGELRGVCSLDTGERYNGSIALRPEGAGAGMNHLVVPGTLPSGERVVVRMALNMLQSTVPKLEPSAVACTLPHRKHAAGGGRAERCPSATEKALHLRCQRMVRASYKVAELRGVPGWPRLLAVGCFAHGFNATHVVGVHFEVRPDFAFAAGAEERQPLRQPTRRLAPQQRPAPAFGFRVPDKWWAAFLSDGRGPPPPECAALHLSREGCIVRAAASSATMLSLVMEAPYQHALTEHDLIRDGIPLLKHRRLSQLAEPARAPQGSQLNLSLVAAVAPALRVVTTSRGHGGQFGYDHASGALVFFDTDHVDVSLDYAWQATSSSWKGHDFVFAWSRTVLLPAIYGLKLLDDKLAGQLETLAADIAARHDFAWALSGPAAALFFAGSPQRERQPAVEPGTVQLSFSCAAAYLRVAAADRLPTEEALPGILQVTSAGRPA